MDNITIMALLSFLGAMVVVMTPIIKLNSSITKLNVTIENINKESTETKKDVKDLKDISNKHETRISLLEDWREQR
jgi:cell division protein FtsL